LSDWKRKVTAEYVPTDAQRFLVESASAFGITQAEIATQLKISEPTLRKHFREELDGGRSSGSDHGDYTVV
jgi:AraC-like DNA-binding protein